VKNDWLTASSFERTFEIMSAINTLSIHAKLRLAGIDDLADPSEVQKAQVKLAAFLEELQNLIQNAEKNQTGLMVGTDPRLGELTLQYMAERRRLPPRSLLYTLSLTQISKLVASEQSEDLPKLIECLQSLRSLFERYAHADVAGMFGDE